MKRAAKTAIMLLLAVLLFGGCSSPKRALEQSGFAFTKDDFFKCVVNGNAEAVRLFLAAGMDPEETKGGATSVIAAVRHKQVDVLRVLLERGANPEAADAEFGATGLMWAMLSDAAEDMARLLLDHGADPNRQAPNGHVALIGAASYGKDSAVKLLLQRGALINSQRTEDGFTALMAAAGADHTSTARLLLQLGADSAVRSKAGWTAERVAYIHGAMATHTVLREMAPVNGDWEELQEAKGQLLSLGLEFTPEAYLEQVQCGATAIVRLFLEAGMDPDRRLFVEEDDEAYPPLYLAIVNNDLAMVRTLVEGGAYLWYLDDAIWGGHFDIADYLVAQGADLNMLCGDGGDIVTPLMWAALRGDVRAVTYLLSKGADPNIAVLVPNVGDGEYTALALARIEGHEEVVRLLQAAGGR